jgi:type II secretion system protein E
MDLGRVLRERGVITGEQLERTLAEAGGRRLDRALIELGVIKEDALLRVLGEELGLPYVELKDASVDAELLARFPARDIFRHTVFPLGRRNGSVQVATSDPFDLDALNELSSTSGFHLEPVLARKDEIARLIRDRLGVGGDTIGELVARRAEEEIELLEGIDEQDGELAEEAKAASVVRLVNELLIEALEQKASDVHVEPQEHGLTVRFRVDGLLRVQPVPPEIMHFQSAIISRLKIMSRLNIAEKRLPQDGRIKLRVKGREIDVRVSIIPMLHGEGIVMRLLDKGRMAFNLANAGMPPSIAKPFYDLIAMPHGIVLVTGPTGSGKTTTLYSALNEIKSATTKIITVEDPVEYHMDGISQIQVHGKIGLTFAAGLRSILRHDPDVVLIGEIRDGETANSAIQASLTGHLVFSTLHTNDAAGAFTRLVDMGVEPYLVASTVEGVLAQRLVRRLCPHCKRAVDPATMDLPPDFPKPMPAVIYEPNGCRECRGTGYSGRIGIYELLHTDEGVRKLCMDRASASVIREHGLKHGMTTLRMDGWNKVVEGVTSVEDVLRTAK